MNRKNMQLKSWVVLYMGLAAVITLADRRPEVDAVNLSPVVFEAVEPALAVDALVRRTDI